LEAATTMGYLFAGLLLPMFSKMISVKESPSELIKLSFNLIFIPAITLFGVCFFYASEIMELLYIENTVESAKVLQVLMLNFVAIAATYIFGTFLTANGSLKVLNRVALIGLLINLTLNFILIPKYASFGAAVATLVTQIFVIVSQIIIVKRILKWKTHLNYVIRIGLFLTLFFVISYFISIRNLDWLLQSTLTIAIGGILALSLKLIEPKSMLQILKNKAGN
jgi:O-antigen/teichoic acid export membrane protein